MLNLDVRRLDRDGILEPGWRGTRMWERDGETVGRIRLHCVSRTRLRLTYTVSSRFDDDTTDYDYPVSLTYTEPHFGGERPWCLCPADGCGRRCAILYGGAVFACRECHDLAYPRENMSGSPWKVARHRLRKLADRLEVDPSRHPTVYPWTPERPKGMHQSTYDELLVEYRKAFKEHEDALHEATVRLVERHTDWREGDGR